MVDTNCCPKLVPIAPPEIFRSPFTSSFVLGLAVPTPRFPPDDVSPEVLPSSSITLSTRRFQDTEERILHEEVLSESESPDEKAAYPTESTATVRKKENPDIIPVFQGEIVLDSIRK